MHCYVHFIGMKNRHFTTVNMKTKIFKSKTKMCIILFCNIWHLAGNLVNTQEKH